MLRALLILMTFALGTAAQAQVAPRPFGYRCGKGKPVPGKGCDCPRKQIEQRTRENHAVCVPAPSSATTTATTTPADPPKPQVPCRQAAAALRRFGASAPDVVRTIAPDKLQQFLSRVAALAASRCVRDRWTIEQATCFVRAKTQSQMEACAEKLTPAQMDALDKGYEQIESSFQKP
jgi:hypothetical protein